MSPRGSVVGGGAVKRIDQWQRLHQIEPPVTLRVVTSPVSGDWLVRVDGWDFPEYFPLLYPSLEIAQRAADDVLINNRQHDCRQHGCGEWMLEGLGSALPGAPDKLM